MIKCQEKDYYAGQFGTTNFLYKSLFIIILIIEQTQLFPSILQSSFIKHIISYPLYESHLLPIPIFYNYNQKLYTAIHQMLQELSISPSKKPTQISLDTPQLTSRLYPSHSQQSQEHTEVNDHHSSEFPQQNQLTHSNHPAISINPPNKQSKENFPKNLLAERPTNNHVQSTQKIPPLQHKTKPTTKTSQNFYVSTTKKPQKTKSSQKIFLTKIASPQSKQNALTMIDNKNQQISDITVLILIHKVVERMRQRGDDMTLECLVNEEKLIQISIAFLERKIVTLEQIEKYFSLEKEIVGFVQKINKVTMENFKDEDENLDVKIFSKAVDLLMTPNMSRFVKDLKTLGKVKVLTFNNLGCIYKKKKKFGIALRSVSFALEIEQGLLNEQTHEQKYDIIPTYLNKAAILSQMNKHQKAIEQIMKSQKFIQKIEKQVIRQISQAQQNQNPELKKRLEEKRYYGLYMKMIINYNMGAEKEHMKMVEAACEYYKQGRQLALMINNELMVRKFEGILNKLMDNRRK